MFKKLLKTEFFFITALALHLAILFLAFFKTQNSDSPVLSFSISINDAASVKQNSISATSVASSVQTKKPKTKQEVTKNDNQNKAQKVEKEQDSKVKSTGKEVSNSKQQNAVFGENAPAIFDAAYLNNPSPSYPVTSKRMGEQGRVLLDVYVNKDGLVEKININKSSGFSRLDNAALNTVKKWQFVPAKKNGNIENSWVQVPINFVLEN
ncbi:MAG: energy transducer TonB [Pseudomonadota bacterium]